MSWKRYARAVILAAVAVVASDSATPPQKKELMVWALPETKVYHCPHSKFYKIGNGKEMGECAAIQLGYRPAFAKCGSNCNTQERTNSNRTLRNEIAFIVSMSPGPQPVQRSAHER